MYNTERDKREQEFENRMKSIVKRVVFGVPLTIFGLVMLFGSYVTVAPGERGVVTHMGKVTGEVLGEGFHFKMPIYTSVEKFTIRVQKTEETSEAASKDLQRIGATFALNWHVDPTTVAKLLQNVGNEEAIKTNILAPAVSEVLKAATAKMTAEEILTKRIELKNNIDEALITRLKAYGVLVDDVSLVNLNFTAEFNHAVEEKQIAEQRSKQSEYEAQRAVVDAKAAVAKARGEAESTLEMAKGASKATLIQAEAQAKANLLLKESITPQLLELRTLERWDGAYPQVISGGGNGVLLTIPTVGKPKISKQSSKGESKEESKDE